MVMVSLTALPGIGPLQEVLAYHRSKSHRISRGKDVKQSESRVRPARGITKFRKFLV